MPLHLPIGIDDFRILRERKLEYVDKSHLISELIDNPGLLAILFPRPRRFGKTLNLSMLRYFFEKRDENLWHLFEGLHIERAGDSYKKHFARYPLIYISFKGIKATSLEVCQASIRDVIWSVYNDHIQLLEHPALNAQEKAKFLSIWQGQASDSIYRGSLLFLCDCLYKVHRERSVILMDEYDAPIHSAFMQGFDRPVLNFFRDFFELSFKGNAHLHLAVITGILRIAKESVFSGLNNLSVFSVLSTRFNTCFGFSEDEVQALLKKANILQHFNSVRAYYNGYSFGGRAIYNPWSILKFLDDEQHRFIPHWLGTSSNDLARDVLQTHASALKDDMETLLLGGTIEKVIDENVSLEDLKTYPGALWSLLVFTGYLKAWYEPIDPHQWNPPAKLAIPNGEIFEIYRSTFKAWLERSLQDQGGSLDTLLKALLSGNAPQVEQQLQHYATHLLSYHDTAHAAVLPERFYHGLLLGLLASLEPNYKVRSNRESGEGRPDILILPTHSSQSGAVIELKIMPRAKSKATEKPYKIPAAVTKILNAALAQAQTKDYAAEIHAAKGKAAHVFAIAFNGKYVWVKAQSST